MNTHLDRELSNDELDARLRSTFTTVMPLLDRPDAHAATGTAIDAADRDHEPLTFDLAHRPGPDHRRAIAAILGAAAAVALVVAGLAVTQRRSTEPSAVAETPLRSVDAEKTPTPATTAIEFEVAEPLASVPLSCEQVDVGSCLSFERLPVLDGVSDFYVGPERLGQPVVALGDFDQLVRCSQLDADGTTCVDVEGFAGVALTRYPSDVTVDTTGVEQSTALDVEIGTTFADITPAQYAAQWTGPTATGDGTRSEPTVRGQASVTFSVGASRYVVWTERPGVLVWVKASTGAPDELLSIAEDVRRTPGPETIPWIVTVADETHGRSYDASSNDADTIVVGREPDGDECVGFGHIESTCQGTIAEQTFVRIIDDRPLVTGVTPPTVSIVRISQNGQLLAEASTRSIDATSNLVFSAFVDAEGPVTVEWVDASGVVAVTEPEIDLCRTACG